MRRPRGGDRGAVVAEFAVALPAVAVILMLCAGALSAATRQVRLQDAAADAARLVSRGESDAWALAVVADAVPGGAGSIHTRDGLVCVTAGAPSGLPLVTIHAESCALAGGL